MVGTLRRQDESGTIPRRAVLAGAGVVTLVAAGPLRFSSPPTAAAGPIRRWSDTRSWGSAPTRGSDVRITDQVLLDADARVRSLTIEAGGQLVLDPTRNVTLTLNGNLLVRGRLTMRPQDARVRHTVRFVGINEATFVGGGMMPVATDVGVWVVDDGVLDVVGTAKAAWVRAAGGLRRGSQVLDLAAVPRGWQVGDEVAVTPTLSPGVKGHSTAYDEAVVTRISGRQVTLDRALRFDHPLVEVPGGTALTAEVLNLSRNARIEGSPSGRTHLMFLTMRPQTVSHMGLRYVGPRRTTSDTYRSGGRRIPISAPVMGRYGMHFHMMGDAARGSVVDGVVVRDAGSHAFVPHASHGVSFRGCISHNSMEDPFWWDQAKDTRTRQVASNDLVYAGCVASLVRCDPPFRGYRLSGFNLGSGEGSRVSDCVAVGIQGSKDSSGFHWPEGAVGHWVTEGCVAHNNARHGAFVWQNTDRHQVSRLVAFHNGGSGISNGAYTNGFAFVECCLHGNHEAQFRAHALSRSGLATVLVNSLVSSSGGDVGLALGMHHLTGDQVRVHGCTFIGHKLAAISLEASSQKPHAVIVTSSTVQGSRFQLSAGAPTGSLAAWVDAYSSESWVKRPQGWLRVSTPSYVPFTGRWAGLDAQLSSSDVSR
ncbi:MAG: G8 domain-containing protein [Motilibacteraceae bacterium]